MEPEDIEALAAVAPAMPSSAPLIRAQRLLASGHDGRSLLSRSGGVVDEDLDGMSRDELVAEVRKLRQGIRTHRDSSGHELCWHHPALWGLLPERQDPLPVVPEWPEFLRGCIRYRQSLDDQLPGSPRSHDQHKGEP